MTMSSPTTTPLLSISPFPYIFHPSLPSPLTTTPLSLSSSPPCRMLPFQAAPGQFGPEVHQPGLMVWRVEKMKAVPLGPSEVGAFFNGDSYLVLENRGDQAADLHMWIGKCNPPGLESGSPRISTTQPKGNPLWPMEILGLLGLIRQGYSAITQGI